MMTKRKKIKAYTLVEMTITFIVISIVATAGFRVLDDNLDAGRATQTLVEMEAIQEAIIGDEMRIGKSGELASFGFWGDGTGSWPRTNSIANFVADLSPYLRTENSADIGEDGWGNSYVLSNGAQFYTVTSQGADDAAGGTGVDTDIVINLNKDLWEDNIVAIIVTDNRGTLLQPVLTTGDATDGHFTRVEIFNAADNIFWSSAGGGTINRSYNAFTTPASWDALVSWIVVTVARGTGGSNGTYDWRPELNDSANTFTSESQQIYPKGSGQAQAFFVKLPGAALLGVNEV